MMQTPAINILFPVYNEEKRLEKGNTATFKAVFEDDIDDDLLMKIYLSGIFSPPQRMAVYSGDVLLFDETVTSIEEPLQIHIPAECISGREAELSLQFPDAISPKDLGQSGDSRDLAFAIKGFSIGRDDG